MEKNYFVFKMHIPALIYERMVEEKSTIWEDKVGQVHELNITERADKHFLEDYDFLKSTELKKKYVSSFVFTSKVWREPEDLENPRLLDVYELELHVNVKEGRECTPEQKKRFLRSFGFYYQLANYEDDENFDDDDYCNCIFDYAYAIGEVYHDI